MKSVASPEDVTGNVNLLGADVATTAQPGVAIAAGRQLRCLPLALAAEHRYIGRTVSRHS